MIGLQLPLGVLNLLIVLKEPSRGCFDCLMPGSVISMRTYWRATAMVELMISFFGIILLAIYCLSLFPPHLQGIQLLTLMFAVEINCIMGLIVYLNMLSSEAIIQYS